MEKEFVPYELALELKKLGFFEECLGFYIWQSWNNNSRLEIGNDDEYTCETIKAPLYQQAFEWFREKYDCEAIYNIIPPEAYKNNDKIKKYSWYVWNLHSDPRIQPNHRGFVDTYEEARLVCLEKLIEIAKKQK